MYVLYKQICICFKPQQFSILIEKKIVPQNFQKTFLEFHIIHKYTRKPNQIYYTRIKMKFLTCNRESCKTGINAKAQRLHNYSQIFY